MRPVMLAVLASLLGGVYLKLGLPQVHAYPSPDGSLVLKLTLSRFPGFVAYLKAPGGRELQPPAG